MPQSLHHNGSFQGPLDAQPIVPQMLRSGSFPSFAQHRSGSTMPRPVPINTYAPSVHRISEPSTPYTSLSGSYSPQTWSFDSSPGVIGQERDLMLDGRSCPSKAMFRTRGDRREPGPASDFGGQYHNVVNTERIRRGLDVRTTVSLALAKSRHHTEINYAIDHAPKYPKQNSAGRP